MISIYIGNIPYKATNEELKELFEPYGKVISAENILNQNTGRSRGFGIVKMEKREDGERAIRELDGQNRLGRKLTVKEDQPREQRRKTQHPQQSQQGEKPQQTQQSYHTITTQRENRSDNYFHNPYTFIPTPSRKDAKGFAGDYDPLKNDLDHASLNKDLWTGHIPIKITTVTPLVLLKDDGRERKPSEPQVYDVHSRIPEPSLRGMLRSAYEVVTNSRYSSFRNDDRLAYRMQPGEAAKLVPTIIKEDKKTNKLKACFFTGTTFPKQDGPKKPRKGKGIDARAATDNAMYAAMLTLHKPYTVKTILEGSYKEPKTGHQVYAEIVLCEKHRYLYWKAIRIWCKSDCSTKPKPGSVPDSWSKNSLYTVPDSNKNIVRVVEGTVLVTNESIDKKHDERIFFLQKNKPLQSIEIKDEHRKNWNALIKNYRDAHTDEDIFNRKHKNKHKEPWAVFIKGKDSRNRPIYDYAWSPHLYHKGNTKDRWGRDVQDALDLKDGTLAYARCEIDDNMGTITAVKDLFPVMISRELYECSPKELLDESLHPAEELDDLSPADRLFGWTPQGPETGGGYKSRIRVVCEDGEQSDILDSFEDDPLPLSILGQPKPEQGRFYVAADREGTPQTGISKQEAGYDNKDRKHLRGRKHYWHHKGT